MIARLRASRAAFEAGAPDVARRIEALGALRTLLLSNEERLAAAISADFRGRSIDETRMLELLPLLDLIGHAQRSVRKWMKPRRARTTWFLLPSGAYTVHQPIGVVGVMSAWNYPLYLSIGPMISALSAGNHVIVKPSERAPRTADLLATLIRETFDAEYVAAITGDADVSRAFAALPFDHLIFTGSTATGARIMAAAAENLTRVTLELGGKSPAIVHGSYPLGTAMERILTGKLFNAGQTCIAPDYLLVSRNAESQVEGIAREVVARRYPRLVDNPDYTRMHSDDSYAAVDAAVEEARAAGARVVRINPANEQCSRENAVYPPTLVFGAPPTTRLLRDEIFAPVLPVVTYESLDDAIAYVNARSRPLALYYFDNDRARINRVVRSTTSGGVTVNDVVYHIAQHNLPFGGVGASGMGQYHGYDGFREFSKIKGVMMQSRFPLTRLLGPPFTGRTRAFLRRLVGFAAR